MTTNKACELCDKQARTFCESDLARLCWDCDEKVHSANFLVAKHCRTLLCHVCRSPTPWKAAGLNLGPAFSVCRNCAEEGTRRGTESGSQIENGESQESESDDGEYYSDSDFLSGGEEEDGENQVVPWSICDPAPPSPSATSTSCSEEETSLRSMKRTSGHTVESENEDESDALGSSSSGFFRPLKVRRSNINLSQFTPTESAVTCENPTESAVFVNTFTHIPAR